MRVCDGTHDSTDGQAVEVVIDEDEYAKSEGGEHGADSRFDVFLCPAAEGGGTARLVEQGDDDAEEDQEQEDTCRAGDRGDHRVVDQVVHGGGGAELGSEQRTDEGTDQQGRIDFFRDKGEADGDDRREQSPQGAGSGGDGRQDCADDGKEHHEADGSDLDPVQLEFFLRSGFLGG